MAKATKKVESNANLGFEATGSTVSNLRIPLLEALPIPHPPLAEQKSIATVLGTLDDKIELNRRMNATLEAMARALFQSWFVDFDPVRSKLGGRSPVDLDKATAALFPDSLQDSPIGPVPNGWKVERFDAHITANRGLSYKGEGLREDGTGLPMHNLNSVYEGGGYKHEGLKHYAGEYREKHLLEPGDMIVTNTEQGFDHLLIGHAATGALNKIIAGYHQFHAVNAAVEETVRASGLNDPGVQRQDTGRYWAGRMHDGKPGDRRAGVVWHTQGSGKSFTMLFFAARVIRESAMQNPTLVVLTDRNDLDDQLFGQFQRCHDILGQMPVQAETQSGSRSSPPTW